MPVPDIVIHLRYLPTRFVALYGTLHATVCTQVWYAATRRDVFVLKHGMLLPGQHGVSSIAAVLGGCRALQHLELSKVLHNRYAMPSTGKHGTSTNRPGTDVGHRGTRTGEYDGTEHGSDVSLYGMKTVY
eukprot:1479641-Rhodomonas_salina.4